MRGALLKKRYGIPAALLLILLLSGTALAWYCFATITSVTTVEEPLSAETTSDFSATMRPQERNTWTFDIVNPSGKQYKVRADLDFDAPEGVRIITFEVDGKPSVGDLLDDNSVTFPMYPHGTVSCKMVIRTDADAATGEVSASFDLYRESG